MSISAPKSHPIRRVARVVIEFTTPFHVGSGKKETDTDALVVTDANGLPAIPGSSLAGALRSVFLAETDPEKTNELFGHQTSSDGRGSRLSLSWAAIHDSTNQPVEPLLDAGKLKTDVVLKNAKTLQLRDHVRITHRGAGDAAEHGKFDQQVVAAGHRFTFEMELVDRESDATWKTLLECLCSDGLRLGGKSRRGLGAYRVEKLSVKGFDLREEEDFDAYAALPKCLSKICPCLTEKPVAVYRTAAAKGAVTIILRLQPRGYWMFGGGEDEPKAGGDPADMAPVRGERIHWNAANKGSVEQVWVRPGTGIKGPISHRVAFHYNRLQKEFAEQWAKNCPNDQEGHKNANMQFAAITGTCNEAVKELFGLAQDGNGKQDKAQAARGRVLLDDAFWAGQLSMQQRITHNSIDRFTGGTLGSHLFSERPFWKGDFQELKLVILNPNPLSKEVKRALKAALEDIIEGRLALGAGSGRGLGYFEGKAGTVPLKCSAGPEWFEQDFTSPNLKHHEPT